MKSINPRLLALALAGLLSATAASALAVQSLPGATPGAAATPSGEPSIKTYDSNGDGKISIEEFKPQGGQEQAFREADANRDNSPTQISQAEKIALAVEGVKGIRNDLQIKR